MNSHDDINAMRRTPSMRNTPHAEELSARIREAEIALEALLTMGCLIDHIRITPETVRLQLVRCPRTSALERHATHSWWYQLNAPEEAMRGLCWRGVFIEWPCHSSDVPNVEAVLS